MLNATLPTAVSPPYQEPILHTIRLADWTQTMERSMLRQMLAVVSRPGILSFGGGLPAPELFPKEDFAGAMARVLATDDRALQYGPPFEPLKRHIVHLMAERGVVCRTEQIFLTTGAQQGLKVIARLLMDPGREVMLEERVYTGIQQVLTPYRPHLRTVPTDLDKGIDIEAVEAHLKRGAEPAFLYLIPEAHNPLGVSITAERRTRLVQLARHYGMPIVEDDPYGFLCYEETAVPATRALDDEWVIYVGSFSKILAPALRLGWMVVPEELVGKLTVVKESYDLETSGLIQRAVSAYLDAGLLPAHIAELRQAYKTRRDAMLKALNRYFPTEARWTRPKGGMFIWVELPSSINTADLLRQAIEEEKVAFIPGSAFCAPGSPTATNCLRLNFSNCTPDKIEEGIGRLGRIISKNLSSIGN
ncbi:MAG: PLP-dependent aminotransferase family protein [Candidatus Promineifilaceae bacterium]